MKRILTTVIEMTHSDIRVVRFERMKGKFLITFHGVRACAGLCDEEISALLKDFLNARPGGNGRVIAVIPRRAVILRLMKLPSHRPDEIEDMISLQLVNAVPYPVEEIIYQYLLLDSDPQGYSRILVVIVPREVALRHCDLLRQAGIREEKLVFSSLGIPDWLACQERAEGVGHAQGIAVLNCDAHHSELLFCQNHKLYFSRIIPWGGGHFVSDGTGELVRQIMMSFKAYFRQEIGSAVERLLVLASEKNGEALAAALAAGLTIPVQYVNALDGISWAEGMDPPITDQETGGSLAAVLGFAFSESGPTINLAPIEIGQESHARIQKNQIIKCAALLTVIGILALTASWIGVLQSEARLREWETALGGLQAPLEKVRLKRGVVEFFDHKRRASVFIPDLIDELIRVTPEEICLRALSLNDERTLVVQGYARAQALINDFQGRMIRSDWFDDVDLKFATKRTVANIPVIDFQIISRLGRGEARP